MCLFLIDTNTFTCGFLAFGLRWKTDHFAFKWSWLLCNQDKRKIQTKSVLRLMFLKCIIQIQGSFKNTGKIKLV